MNDLSKDTVKKIANLAHLDLSDEEVLIFQGQLSNVLDSMNEMIEIVDKNTERSFHSIPMENVFREDVVDESQILSQEEALSCAPKSADGKFLVPKMLDE